MAKKDKSADEDDKKEKDEDEAPEGEEGAEGGGLTKKKKIIIAAAAGVVLLVGVVAGLYFTGHLPGFKPKAHTEEAAAPAEEKPVEGEAKGKEGKDKDKAAASPVQHGGDVVYYHMPEVLVNLNTGGKQTSFLKMEIAVELPADADAKAIEANLPRIQDDFNTYLRELRPSDLSGSAGLYRLKEELLTRINKIVYPNHVNDILFKEILVQ